MIELDGSYGEGGGSIVRQALALSTLTRKPFRVTDIRRGRCKSGLKAQHLHCVKALQELCGAKVKGVNLGSHEIIYIPEKIKAKTLNIDVGTAGSITLLMQSLLLPCIFANRVITIRIKGGTDTRWSMPIDYFKEVLLPQLNRFAEIDCRLEKRGYYPMGGGKVTLKIKPKVSVGDFSEFKEFLGRIHDKHFVIKLVKQGQLIQIKGVSHAAKILEKADVADRQARAAKMELNKLNAPIKIRKEYADVLCAGSGITLWAVFSLQDDEIDLNNPIRIGADALGERGKPAEKVGTEAGKRLIEEISSGAPVDKHLADNLIPILALVGGRMKVSEISDHTRTNIYVVEKFLDVKFKIDEEDKIIRANINDN
ncbi:RNA 3'-phosphate cyclase [Candidatus Woesearchaeota archaeon]|nr:MAG: RNA 3'-phosphate cyclase [Candidatus Woesearchaeota archaeon]